MQLTIIIRGGEVKITESTGDISILNNPLVVDRILKEVTLLATSKGSSTQGMDEFTVSLSEMKICSYHPNEDRQIHSCCSKRILHECVHCSYASYKCSSCLICPSCKMSCPRCPREEELGDDDYDQYQEEDERDYNDF